MAGDSIDFFKKTLPGKLEKKSTKVIIGLVLIATCIGGYIAFGSMGKEESTYLTMPVTKGDIVDAIEATGTIKPLRELDLFFKRQGTLKSLNAREGDEVKEGQVLAEQENADLQASVEQARSDLMSAEYRAQQTELEYEKAKDTYDQQQALYAQGAVAKADLDQARRDYLNAEINLKLAKASIDAAKAKLVIAESELQNAVLKAPFSGIVAEVNGEIGQETGNSSEPTFHVISKDLQIHVMVNEADIGRVKPGQEVEFTVISYPDKTFKGKVSRISQQATSQNNIQLYDVNIDTVDLDRELLLAGMSVTARIYVNQCKDVTVVPALAISFAKTFMQTAPEEMRNAALPASSPDADNSPRTRGNTEETIPENSNLTTPVVVLENGRPVIKRIEVGLSDGQNTEVISGLNLGERVVIGTTTGSSSVSGSGTGNTGGTSIRQRAPGMGGGPMMMPR